MTLPARFLAELTAAVPTASTEESSRAAVAVDRSGIVAEGVPDVVVRASTVGDVRATLRLAFEHGVPVVPRGAGTGLAGARSPRRARSCSM